MIAGMSTTRITNASRKIATARPRPSSFMKRASDVTKEPNTTTMMDAAATMTRDDLGQSAAHREGVVARRVPQLRHPAHQEHLVVHRQSKQQREQDERDEGLDGAAATHADAAGGPSPTGTPPPRSRKPRRRSDRLSAAPTSGSTRERKATSSTSIESPTTSAKNSGIDCAILAVKSMLEARFSAHVNRVAGGGWRVVGADAFDQIVGGLRLRTRRGHHLEQRGVTCGVGIGPMTGGNAGSS